MVSVIGAIQCKDDKERIAETKKLQRQIKNIKISRDGNLIIYYYQTDESIF